jgi:phage/plasmid-associated DNA primase
VILSNELPRLTDSSGALASRFITLIMTRSFYGRENPTLTTELCAELPGIFNWALDGLERLRERGRFQQPTASQDAIREMEDLSSPMGAFVRDRCVVGPVHEVPCDDLYQAWRHWYQDHGRDRPGTTQTFGRDLRAVLPGIKVTQPRIGADERIRKYAGLALGGGEYNSADRVPSRANWRTGATNPEAARDPVRSHAGADVAENLGKQQAGGDLARDGTRSKPMYSHDESNGLGTCSYCGAPIDPAGGHTATSSGEYLHNQCVDEWSRA